MSKLEEKKLSVPNDFHMVRLVTERSLGNLLGQVKEIIEASIENDRQCDKLKNIVADKFYDWFSSIGDKLTVDEMNEAIGIHWEKLSAKLVKCKCGYEFYNTSDKHCWRFCPNCSNDFASDAVKEQK